MPLRLKITILYLLGFSIDLANMFIVNAAYPTIQREFDASVTQLAWIGNMYALGLTVVIPLGSWMARRLGERRLLIISLLLFAVASFGVGLAGSIHALLAWRLVQGLGGGLLIPVGQAMAYRACPPEGRAALTALVMMTALLVPALSPAAGGLLVDYVSWRAIFLSMIPLALLTAAFAWCWLPADASAQDGSRLDAGGLGLSVAALACLLLAMSMLGQPEQGAGAVLAMGAAIAAAIAYVVHARRAVSPVLDLSLLQDLQLRTGLVIYLCVPGGFAGVSMVAALYFQNTLGLSATQTGALMMPWAIAACLAILITRHAFARLGSKPLFLAGIAIDVCGIALLATPLVQQGIGRAAAFAAMGLGASLCTSAAQSAAFQAIAPHRMGDASALWNINRQLSFCIGTALLGSVLAWLLVRHAGDPSMAYRQCFAVAALLALLPLPFVMRLPMPRALASISHQP
ncbi:MFS transporter [Massilia sp. MB5]|uniref:MFS transporter n=1 Tax=Massilia sp. MB5 TaxID=2919578 RepID=UPI001F115E37|nr:MFS transporter [Massilia sp. MB5]UMR28544.1 MFS transporter [Massilia sp. MB5]